MVKKFVFKVAFSANKAKMSGFRIHDYQHSHWKKDLEIVLSLACIHSSFLFYHTLFKGKTNGLLEEKKEKKRAHFLRAARRGLSN